MWLNISKGSIWRSQHLGLPLSFGKVLLSAGVEILGGEEGRDEGCWCTRG